MRMRAWALLAALAINLLIGTVAAQQEVSGAESHILSALTSRADPRVLAEDVRLGPALRGELGAESDSRTIYGALIERVSGRPLRVNLLPPAEAARYASLAGGNPADPLVLVEAGDLALLMQYTAKQKEVVFVEQLSKPAPRAEPQLPPEAPKPAPVVEVPLPPAPPPLAEKPKPPVVMEKPKPAPMVAVPAPAARPALVLPPPAPLARPEKPRPGLKPRGECVIKPVMSEEDLWNCSAPARPIALEALPAPVAAPKPQPRAVEAPRPRGECVIKPVMSDEDLRACGVRR